MSSWVAIIRTVSRWSPHTICLTRSVLISVLHDESLLLLSTFELFVPLKIMCAQHDVIFRNLLKHFKCLRQCLSQLDKKLQVYFRLTLRLHLHTPKVTCQMIIHSAYPPFNDSSRSIVSPVTFLTYSLYIYMCVYVCVSLCVRVIFITLD